MALLSTGTLYQVRANLPGPAPCVVPSSLNQAQKAFMRRLNNPGLARNGQFVWSKFYRDELRKEVARLLLGSPDLERALPTVPGIHPSATDALILAAQERNGAAFRALYKLLLNAVDAYIAKHPGDAMAKQFRRLLILPESVGKQAYALAQASLTRGGSVVPGTKGYNTAFARSRLGFRGALGISKWSARGCFDIVNAVGLHLAKRGGIYGCRRGSKPSLGQVYRNPVVHETAPWFDLVQYSSFLPTAVARADAALNQDFTLRADVISGTHVGLGIPKVPISSASVPDHFILIIGHEPHLGRFLFWDGDATQSTVPYGDGFGILYHLGSSGGGDGRTAPRTAFPNGILTTAEDLHDLRVFNDGSHRKNGNKRYQVTAIAVL